MQIFIIRPISDWGRSVLFLLCWEFFHKCFIEFCQMLLCIYQNNHILFSFFFFDMVDYIDWFANAEWSCNPGVNATIKMHYQFDHYHFIFAFKLLTFCWVFVSMFMRNGDQYHCFFLHVMFCLVLIYELMLVLQNEWVNVAFFFSEGLLHRFFLKYLTEFTIHDTWPWRWRDRLLSQTLHLV